MEEYLILIVKQRSRRHGKLHLRYRKDREPSPFQRVRPVGWWTPPRAYVSDRAARLDVVEKEMPQGAGESPGSWREVHARVSRAQSAGRVAACIGILALVVGSAIIAKEMKTPPALANVRIMTVDRGIKLPVQAPIGQDGDAPRVEFAELPAVGVPVGDDPMFIPVNPLDQFRDARKKWGALLDDPTVRWFNGRPVRPAYTMWMTVTGYSPDARSCGNSADGLTATLHHVETNAYRLVAADPKVLPYGSMVTVGGYAEDQIVPVLDCGSAIKGRRLDCLFPTHEQARKWGVQRIKVTVWGYADGGPRENPRKSR